MSVETERLDQEQQVQEAVSRLSDQELWSAKSLRPLYSVGESWIVESAIDTRRRELARKKAFEWLDHEMPIQDIFRTNEYDEFSAYLAGVKDLLAEYDRVSIPAKRILLDIEHSAFVTPEKVDVTPLPRYIELQAALKAKGIDLSRRDKLADVLTNFRLGLSVVDMVNSPVGSTDCELLEPTAAYLATQEIQHSYLTRFFALCFLSRLRKEIVPRVSLAKKMAKYGIAIFALLWLLPSRNWLMEATIEFWPITAIVVVILLFGARSLFLAIKSERVLEHLISQFERLNEPSTIDGRELIPQLRKLENSGLIIPSLLFSLFQITLPGAVNH